VKKPSTFEWNKMFKESRVKVTDIERSGCLEKQRSNENFEEVSNFFFSDKRLLTRKVA
jgi:hypothetical protein